MKLTPAMFALAASTLLLLGCGGSDVPDLGTVTGKVTYGGNPMPNVIVLFTPVGEGRPSTGETNENGEYELTYTEGNAGAVPGEYKVTLSAISPEDSEGEDVQLPEIPNEALDGSIIKKVEGGSQTINIEL